MEATAKRDSFLELVAEVLGVDTAELTDQCGPANLPAWTSRRHLELVVTFEQEYGVELTHQEIRAMRTLGVARGLLAARGARI